MNYKIYSGCVKTALLFASGSDIAGYNQLIKEEAGIPPKKKCGGDFKKKNIEVSNAIDLVIEQSDVTEMI
jgi:hypothetical protein